MKRTIGYCTVLVCFAINISALAQDKSTTMQTGVSEALANNRKQLLSDIHYQLSFEIPAARSQVIPATEVLTFNYKGSGLPLQLDFKEKVDRLKTLVVNGKETPVVLEKEHIMIPATFLNEGTNELRINFSAGELSLNRNNDFLYTLLVPDRARTLFPCFDQPNLKARFLLTLTMPKEWLAIANGALIDSVINGNSKTYHYNESDLVPTYLFSFAAGRFFKAHDEKGRPMTFLYRETDSTKIRLSLDTIFYIHNSALHFLEDYTSIKYPFQKLDFVGIPDFQYGGMEHVGAIQYKAATLFLDSGATQDQQNARSNLIAHETSHMWFGDLVTMQWFNDVWMKEVFANFMADKITRDPASGNDYELKFLTTHFPRAYSVDRTAGANPIRQPLSNLQEAGTLYGPIIYDKAPVMMRQLERLMGETAFRDGLREYLKKYSYSNATWPDLISILDAGTTADLQSWNKVWVNTPGRPVISYEMQKENRIITRFVIKQKGEQQNNYLLPQFFEIALVYPGHVEEYTVNLNKPQVELAELKGKQLPSFILLNSSGQGYGLFALDKNMLSKLTELTNPVMRASAYITLYENMLEGKYIQPGELLSLYQSLLGKETEELNLSLVSGHIADIYWRLLLPSVRKQLSNSLEQLLWNALDKEAATGKKKILFRSYQSIALSAAALNRLYRIWKEQKPPEGVKLSEDDYTSLALSLAVKDYTDTTILTQQLTRLQNPDRRNRLQFLMPALSADQKVRDAFFASLNNQQVRKKESWVAEALSYLHHPLRTANSQKYLAHSLDLLQEIQLTGDIFFPGSWLSSTFGNYQTPAAANIVRQFLQTHKDYNPKLKAKILQAADPLFRAEKLVYGRSKS
jgi:aminopeptidase N